MKRFQYFKILVSLFIIQILINATLKAQVKEYFITCDPDDFAYIYEHYEEDIYIPITFSYDGTTWTDTDMRLRGDSSREFPKKSLKVRFNGNPFIDGDDKLNFNAEYADISYIRSYLCAKTFAISGQSCFDADYARLYLNGDFLGLYLMVENVDEKYLENRGYDPQGNLYKAAVDGACMSIWDNLETVWTQETGSGNMEDLAQFITNLNQTSDEEYLNFCNNNMDYEQMINIIAANMILSNYSTYYHNYFMYHDVNGSGKWEMMPWDLDKTMSLNAWQNFTHSSAPWAHDNPFLERALLNETIFDDIKIRAAQLRSDVFTTGYFWPLIDSLVAELTPSILEDTTDNIQDIQEWLDQVTIEKNYIASQPTHLLWLFDHVQSSFVATPTPEIMPAGDVTFSWTPSVDPDGNPVEYHLSLTTSFAFEPNFTDTYTGIFDTSFTINNIAGGDYFWQVVSYNTNNEPVYGFDSKTPLTIRNFQTLPCNITSNMELTSQNSPYLVNCNTIIEEQAKLTLQAGVKLFFNNNTYLKVMGGLEVAGTKENPVIIEPFDPDGSFDSLVFVNPAQNIRIDHLHMTDGAIYAYNANVKVDNSDFSLVNKELPGQNVFYRHYYGNISFENSSLHGNNTGQGLEFGYCDTALISNSFFSNISDPMEFISITDNGWVINNFAMNSNDDCIDFNNCKNLTVSGNTLYNASDNGISIGADVNGFCENIYVAKNLVVGCTTGILVKDSSDALLDRNTLYNNLSGIRVVEEHAGWGNSRAQVVNTIISNSQNQAWLADEFSEISINYSLCDTETLPGTGNLFGNPGFSDVADSVYTLLPGSVCINSGDPGSAPDPDGTVADMGAFFFNFGEFNVIFNEINYKSASDWDTEDWVELYNVEEIPADISGWIFKDNDDSHAYEIPFGTIIPSGQYLVLCRSSFKFSQLNPEVENYLGDFDFGLSSSGEMIRLFNQNGVLIDSIIFGNENPWPPEPNGQGPTLELQNPFLDNTLPQNWCASSGNGSPGSINSCITYLLPENIRKPFAYLLYPNPSFGESFLEIHNDSAGKLQLEIYNDEGRMVYNFTKNFTDSNSYTFQLNNIPGNGLFLVKIIFETSTERYSEHTKFIKVD